MGLGFTMTRNAVWSLWNIRFMAKLSKRALRMTTDSRLSSPSRIERLFAGEITWTLLPHGRRSLAHENGLRKRSSTAFRTTCRAVSRVSQALAYADGTVVPHFLRPRFTVRRF